MSRSSSLRCRLFLGVLVLFCIAPTWGGGVCAGPLPLTLVGEGAGADVTVTFTNPTPDYPNGFTLTGFAGQMDLQLGNNPEFIGFCVDLAHFVTTGQTYWVNADSTSSLTNGAQVAYLANTYGPQSLSNVQAAGLQIAIWSELYDNGSGFTAPQDVFQYTAAENAYDPNYSAIAAAATDYLHDAQHQSASSTWYDGSPSGDGQWRGQNMVVADPPPVPEPSTFVLFGLGLGLMGIFCVWKRCRLLAT